jgi:hypothetical protein
VPERLGKALADGWNLRAAVLEYMPEGGGSHHWKLTGEDGQPHFVTVDDLNDKDWHRCGPGRPGSRRVVTRWPLGFAEEQTRPHR